MRHTMIQMIRSFTENLYFVIIGEGGTVSNVRQFFFIDSEKVPSSVLSFIEAKVDICLWAVVQNDWCGQRV